MADPVIMDINKPYVLKNRPKPRAYPPEVIAMMTPAAREKYVPLPVADPVIGNAAPNGDDDEDELDEPQFDWNAPTNPELPSLMDALGADDDDDDNLVMITADPDAEPEEEEENNLLSPSKRQRRHS